MNFLYLITEFKKVIVNFINVICMNIILPVIRIFDKKN